MKIYMLYYVNLLPGKNSDEEFGCFPGIFNSDSLKSFFSFSDDSFDESSDSLR